MSRKSFIFIISAILLSYTTPKAHAVMSLDLGKIVITTSRMAQHGYKIASNVSVIDKEQIALSNARTISEILQQELGVHMYDNSTAKTAIIDIRGFGDTASRNVLVLVNDRRVNAIDVSGPDSLQIPLESIDRIEIIRGAGSVLYGDNAVGGVVNIITKKGEGDISGSFSTTHGSYSTHMYDAEVSGSKNNVSYYLYSKYSDTDGYRTNSNLLTRDYNGRLSYEYSDKLSVDLNTGWHEDEAGAPGGLTMAELESLGRRGTADPGDFSSTKDRYFDISFDFKPWPEDIEFGHFVVDFGYRNRDTFGSFAAFNFNTKRNIDTYNVNGKYIFDHTIFNKEFNFVVGVDYYDTDNAILGSGSNTDALTISKQEIGSYLFAEYEALDNLFVNAGTRFQKAEYEFDQTAAVRAFNSASPSESVNQAGMKYEYNKGSNVFWNVQQTFRYLATDEWYNSFTGDLSLDLTQQTGIQYEVGWQHNYQDKTIFSVTPYWMDLKNEIFFNPSSGFFGGNDNYEKTRRVGVEVGSKTDLLKHFDIAFLDKFEFLANYTFQDPEFNGGSNDGKLIPMAPEHQSKFGMNIKFLEHISFVLSGRYVGSMFAINDTMNATSRVKPYYVMDAKLAYERNNFEIYAALNNMFDEQYNSFVVKSASSSTKDFYPAPERNFLVGAKIKF